MHPAWAAIDDLGQLERWGDHLAVAGARDVGTPALLDGPQLAGLDGQDVLCARRDPRRRGARRLTH